MKQVKYGPGDVVVVRDEREILSILDREGTTDGLPFMPEMRRYCGRELTVKCRIGRFHIEGVGVRGIRNAFILKEARCHGESHNGCGRECYFIFKEAWLKESQRTQEAGNATGTTLQPEEVSGYWKQNGAPCQGQAAPLLRATYPLSAWDLRQYVDDIRYKTYTPYDIAAFLLLRLIKRWGAREDVWRFDMGRKSLQTLAAMSLRILRQNVEWFGEKWASRRPGDAPAMSAERTPAMKFEGSAPALKPGDLVEVKSRNEILPTLSPGGRHYGMGFHGCMWQYCGRRFKVHSKVSCLYDERFDKWVPRIKTPFCWKG